MNPNIYVSAFTATPTGRRVYHEAVFEHPDRISDDVGYQRMKARFIEEIGKPLDQVVILMWRRLE